MLREAFDQQRTEIIRDICDEMDARFSALRNEMHDDMQTLEEHINGNVTSLVTENIMPAINRVHDRVDGVEKRLDGIDTRLDSVDARFDAMDAKFDAMDTRFDESDKRSNGLMQKIDRLETNLTKEIRLVRNFAGMA